MISNRGKRLISTVWEEISRRFLNSLPGLIFILAFVTLFGALIFQKFEAPNEHHSRLHVSKTRQKIFVLAQKLAKKGDSADWSKLVAQVDRYRDKLLESWRSGTDELTVELPTKWTIWGSVYYCFTLFTTIGYGDLFPATTLGKLFTLLYGTAVIPICSLLVSRISSGLVRFCKAIYLMTLESSGLPMGLREAYGRTDASFNFRILPCLVLFVAYLLFGAGVYSYVAGSRLIKWNTIDAIYFAFITITTVGFGDLVPDADTFFAILSIAYMLFGLALTGIVFGRLTMAFDQLLSRWSAITDTTTSVPDNATGKTRATRMTAAQQQQHVKQT
ncbi:TWiK family of potassium channels protein 7 [Paragonimus heterotremus]|uniref:TWiK family of potassium channels protein 7 n=1 Tax=Paragonimus heterotremus TaxID=100268 RepID=A0A8J4THN7_9TREM|nr:TWiK family of potassium channels protein 7 [Paragonimus heterotremus]